MSLRKMERNDVGAVTKLLSEAEWAFLPHEISRLIELHPGLTLVAERDTGLIGVAMGALHGELGWLGNVAVKSSERGGGIGRRLVEATIGELEGAGAAGVRLASTAVAVRMYERLGFVEEGAVTALAGVLDTRPVPQPTPPAAMQIESLLALDRRVFGADRSRTLRRLISEFKETIAATGSPVDGYAVAHDGMLGPLIVADGDPRRAEALLRAAAASTDGKIELAVPSANVAAAGLFARLGFKESFNTTLMRRGRAPDMDLKAIFSLGGLEKG